MCFPSFMLETERKGTDSAARLWHHGYQISLKKLKRLMELPNGTKTQIHLES